MDFYTSVSKQANDICVRGYKNGKRVRNRIKNYEPTLFVVDSTGESEWRTYDGKCVAPIQVGNTTELHRWKEKYKEIENFPIYGYERYAQQWITENFPPEIDFDYSLFRVAFIDIEVSSEEGFPSPDEANYPVTAITLWLQGKYYVWATQPWENKKGLDVEFHLIEDEKTLLDDFMMRWSQLDIDIVTGWNVRFFDLPYIFNRNEKLLGSDVNRRFSPWGTARMRETFGSTGKKQNYVDVLGIATLDYIELYKKFTYVNRESYRLDYIANVELGTGKLSFEEYGSLHTLWKHDYQKYLDYNIQDVDLVVQLEEKMKLIETAVTLTISMKSIPDACFTQVQMWDNKIYDVLWRQKVVVPPRKDVENRESVEGAFVKDVHPGMYNWVMSFDLNSLYPHLIMQYNVSPETYRGVDTTPGVKAFLDKTAEIPTDCTMTPNGAKFNKDAQGFLPKLMQQFYDDRKQFKKQMLIHEQEMVNTSDPAEKLRLSKLVSSLNNLQMARKISLNSAYGALGNIHFRWYNRNLAEAITLAGQLSIKTAEKAVNDWMNKLFKTDKDYVIAADTDSLYVNMEDMVNDRFKDLPFDPMETAVVEFLDKVGDGPLQDVIDDSYKDLAKYTNAFEQKMFMKREGISSKGIWTAKKHYILNVWNNEGVQYTKPKLKMMGIDAVKSSTPSACRDNLKESFNIIMNKSEDHLQEFVGKFKEKFHGLPIEDVCFPRSVKGLGKYGDRNEIYKQGTPIHVRGSLLYNNQLSKHQLTQKYAKIQEGEKIKFVYLKMPNPIRENVIAMVDGLPPEFGLNEYVDRDMMFDKTFRMPLNDIVEKIGWSLEKRNTIEDFFG